MIMFKRSKVITILVCAVVASNAMACKRGHSAVNQNGSDKVIAQLRYGWKNVSPKAVPAQMKKPTFIVKRGKSTSPIF
jgi:hypothetical protein